MKKRYIAAIFCIALLTLSISRPLFSDEITRKLYERKHPELKECLNLREELLVGECILQTADKYDEPTLCRLNPTPFGEGRCYTYFSRQKESMEYCLMIGDPTEKDKCLYDAALRSGDEKACALIADDESKLGCMANVLGDPAYCKCIQNPPARDWCLRRLSLKLKNPNLCMQITDEEHKDKCLLEYVRKNRMSSEVCARIGDDTLYRECLDAGVILIS